MNVMQSDGGGGLVGIAHLDTDYMETSIQDFSDGVEKYNNILSRVQTTVSTLLKTWEGDGKTKFEYDYSILYKQLEDIGDVLYEMYNNLIDAEAEYIETDNYLGKNL